MVEFCGAPREAEMKLASVLVSAVLALLAVTAHAQQAAPQTANLQTPEAKRSYAIGVQVAEGIKSQGVAVNPAMVAAGLRDALAGAKLLMTDDEIGAAIMALQVEMKQKEEQARAADARKEQERRRRVPGGQRARKKAWSACPAVCSTRF